MTSPAAAKLSAPTVALAVAHAGSDFAQGAVPAVGAVFAAHGLVDLGQVGVLVFAVNAGSSVLQPVLGVIADRTGWAWTAVAGVVVAAAGLCGLGAAPGFSGMVVATVLCGIGVAAFHPEAGRLVRASADVDMSARAMSVFALGGNIGFALGPIVAAPAAMAAGAAGVCALAAIPVAAVVPLVWAIRAHNATLSAESVPVGSGPADQPSHAADGRERWLGFGCLGVVITLRSAGYYSLQAFVPAYLVATFAVTNAAGAQGLTVLVVAGTAATMVGGWRARRTPHMALISWPLAAVAAATLALLWAPTYLVALIALAAAGAATFAGFSPSITLAQNYLPRRTALASAVGLGLAPGIGSALAIPVTQIAQHIGYTPALIVLAVLPMLALPMALMLRPATADRPSAAVSTT